MSLPFLCAAAVVIAVIDGNATLAVMWTVLGLANVWQWFTSWRNAEPDSESQDRRFLPRFLGVSLLVVFSIGIGVVAILNGRAIIGVVVLCTNVPAILVLTRGIRHARKPPEPRPAKESDRSP